MNRSLSRYTHHLPLFLLICFIIAEIIALSLLFSLHKKDWKRTRDEYLANNLEKVSKTLEREFDKVSLLISGFKNYVSHSSQLTDENSAREFVNSQIDYLDYADNIIINFLDTNHTFLYSISNKTDSLGDLTGTNAADLRTEEEIRTVEELLKSDEIIPFPPLNLYEGYVGFPVDFSYKVDYKTLGYFAIILDARDLLKPIEQFDLKDEFTFRYTAGNDKIEFDGYQVFDGSKVYSSMQDERNLHLKIDDYTYASIDFLGLPISIGMSYIEEDKMANLGGFLKSFSGTLMLVLIGTSFLTYLFYQNTQKKREQEKLNLALSKSNGLLKNFIFASSHDLKQPLINISNFQNLLAKRQAENYDESEKKYLNVIAQNVNHMTTLLDDLLIYSGLINKTRNKQMVDVEEVLKQIMVSIDQEVVKLELVNIRPCYGVQTEITRCFQNLISNSIKYNKNDTIHIKIRAYETKNFTFYKISDNGIGIPKEHHKIVFSAFQRLNKRDYPGTGLGLSICKEIISSHGGIISIEERPEGGTSITFSISKK